MNNRTPTTPDGRIRKQKHITIPQETIDVIQTFATRHKMTFSRAIELLALASIHDTQEQAKIDMLADVTEKVMLKNMNRFAKLIVYAGIEAGQARQASSEIYEHLLWRAGSSISDIEELESLVKPSRGERASATKKVHRKHERGWRSQAVKAMKNPIAEIWEIMEELDIKEEAQQVAGQDATQQNAKQEA